MSAKHQYIVTGFGNPFNSLEDAKLNILVSFTPREAVTLLCNNEKIYHYIGDKLHSVTPIKVDVSGKVSFGRTELV